MYMTSWTEQEIGGWREMPCWVSTAEQAEDLVDCLIQRRPVTRARVYDLRTTEMVLDVVVTRTVREGEALAV